MAHAISADLPCCVCSYNLKGLDPASNCPECGQPICRTFTYDLVYADPAWLRHQARTVPLLGALVLLNFLPYSYPTAEWLGYVFMLALAVTNFWASVRLKREDPTTPGSDDGALGRAVCLAAFAGTVLTAVRTPASNSPTLDAPGGVLLIAGSVVLSLNGLLTMLLLRRIVRRTRNPSLLSHTTFVLYALPAYPVAFLLAFSFGRFPYLQEVYTALMYTMTAVHWAGTAAGYALLILLGRLYEVLVTAARTPAPAAATQPAVTDVSDKRADSP